MCVCRQTAAGLARLVRPVSLRPDTVAPKAINSRLLVSITESGSAFCLLATVKRPAQCPGKQKELCHDRTGQRAAMLGVLQRTCLLLWHHVTSGRGDDRLGCRRAIKASGTEAGNGLQHGPVEQGRPCQACAGALRSCQTQRGIQLVYRAQKGPREAGCSWLWS